jgi:hypothetical protein
VHKTKMAILKGNFEEMIANFELVKTKKEIASDERDKLQKKLTSFEAPKKNASPLLPSAVKN